MELMFKQDATDNEIWHQYVVVNTTPFHSGSLHRDILDSMLEGLKLGTTVYDLTNPDTINCDSFSISVSRASINF